MPEGQVRVITPACRERVSAEKRRAAGGGGRSPVEARRGARAVSGAGRKSSSTTRSGPRHSSRSAPGSTPQPDHVLDFQVFFAGDRSSQMIYDVPHLRTLSTGSFGGGGPHPFGTARGAARAATPTSSPVSPHVDIMAARAAWTGGIPAEEPRRPACARAQGRRRHVQVDAGQGPSRRGYGVALLDYLNTYVAAMAEVASTRRPGRFA